MIIYINVESLTFRHLTTPLQTSSHLSRVAFYFLALGWGIISKIKKINELSAVRTWQNPPTILSTSLFSISFGCSLPCLEDCFAVSARVSSFMWSLSPQIAYRLRFRPQSVWLWQYGSTSCMLWSAKQFGWKTTAAEGQDARKLQPAQYIVKHRHMHFWFDLVWW